MNKEEALTFLKSGQDIEGNQFEILQIAASEVNNDPNSKLANCIDPLLACPRNWAISLFGARYFIIKGGYCI